MQLTQATAQSHHLPLNINDQVTDNLDIYPLQVQRTFVIRNLHSAWYVMVLLQSAPLLVYNYYLHLRITNHQCNRPLHNLQQQQESCSLNYCNLSPYIIHPIPQAIFQPKQPQIHWLLKFAPFSTWDLLSISNSKSIYSHNFHNCFQQSERLMLVRSFILSLISLINNDLTESTDSDSDYCWLFYSTWSLKCQTHLAANPPAQNAD